MRQVAEIDLNSPVRIGHSLLSKRIAEIG